MTTGMNGGIVTLRGIVVKRNGKAPMASRGLFPFDSGLLAAGEAAASFPPRILHWRLAPFPCTDRGRKLRSSSQRMTWCLEKRTFDSILK